MSTLLKTGDEALKAAVKAYVSENDFLDDDDAYDHVNDVLQEVLDEDPRFNAAL